MTIKDLIFLQSLHEIATEFRKMNNIPHDRQEEITASLELLLKELTQMDVVESDDVLLVVERLSEEEVYYDATTYPIDELWKWKDSPESSKNTPTKEEIFQFSMDECNELFQKFTLPQGYSFMMTPRQETMGYKVNQANVEYLGAVTYVAAFLDELTFFGFDEEDTVAEKEELDRRCEDLEKARALPPEEQEKYLIPAEKVWERLGITDERSEEEKEADHLLWRREAVIDYVNKIKMLQTIVK